MSKTGRIGKKNYTRLDQMIADEKTSQEMSEILDVNPETIRKYARKRGLTITPVDQSLENHPSWKGGTTLDRSGYILQRVQADGEHGYLIRALREGDRRGYAPVHRVNMHDSLGRNLKPLEVVDHIDGDVKNNDLSNLRVFETNAAHLKETLKGRVPNWTAEGKARITGRPPKNRQQKD